MANKPQMTVHVQSSVFKELLTTQVEALDTLKSMKEIMDVAQKMKVESTGVAENQVKKITEENTKLMKESSLLREKEISKMKEKLKLLDEESEAIANIAKGMTTFKNWSDKWEDTTKKLRDQFSPSGMKMGILKSLNIGGVFNKSIEREKFIKAQRAMGSEKSRGELKKDFEGAQASAKGIKKTDKEIEDFKKLTGLSDSEMAKTAGGRKLLDKRKGQTEEYSKFDIRAGMVRRGDNETPSQKFADKGAQEEAAIEQNKMIDQQTTLMTKIEENTRGASPEQKAKPVAKSEEKGGLLGNLLGGGGMGKALNGLKQFGIGIILVAGALFVAAKAFQQFAEVAWEDVGKGLVALGGLVLAAVALDKVKGNIIAGAASLGILALATWGIGAALKTFSDLDWETIGKGMAAVAGLGIIGAVAGTAAPLIAAGAASLGLMGGALWIIGEAMQAVGKGFTELNDGLQKLSNLDGENLLRVAAGVGALGLAMVAFGASQAVAGLGNLVGRLLTIGTDSPVDQLIKIGQNGEGVEKAANGMQRLGSAMVAFNKVDKKSMEVINDFPWLKATAFVAAGGAMSVDGTKVYNASKGNADEAAKASDKKQGQTNVVNAPVNNVTRQNNNIKPAVRNQESSVSQFNRERLAAFL